MNILYFAPIQLYPKGHGNRATVHQYIKRLQKSGHKVHYLLLDEENAPVRNLYIAQQYVDTLDVIPNESPRARENNGYYQFDSWYFPRLGETVAKLCTLYKIDVVICTYVMYSKILDEVPAGILKIIDTHDKMTDRHLLLKQNGIKDEFFTCTGEDEAKYLNRADIIWARNENETIYFNKITNSNKAITVSHFDEPNYLHKNIKAIKKFGFLASDNNVNAKLTEDFINIFTDKLIQSPANIELIIGGNVKRLIENSDLIQAKLSEFPIKLIGFVKENIDFYQQVDCVICPITFGTGINVKMIEAMSYGLPVLTTECGIKGVDSTSKYHHFQDSVSLVDGLWEIKDNETEIKKLIQKSIQIFDDFYKVNAQKFDACFKEKK